MGNMLAADHDAVGFALMYVFGSQVEKTLTRGRCENVEEKNTGRQIGFALSGVSIGTTIVRNPHSPFSSADDACHVGSTHWRRSLLQIRMARPFHLLHHHLRHRPNLATARDRAEGSEEMGGDRGEGDPGGGQPINGIVGGNST